MKIAPVFQRILDGASSVAVLAVCILILVQAVRTYNVPAPAVETPLAAKRLAPGDRLDPIVGLDLSVSPRTLVMAIQSTCHYCTESMPFYRELTAERGAAIRLAVVAPDDLTVAKQYTAAHGFAPDSILTSGLSAMRVSGTPTLLLVNQSGVIERVWVGKLTAEREKEVLAEVRR